jgi:toxin ParE1/3/4
MRTRWLRQGLEDLQFAVAYIREDNPDAARRLYEAVRKQVTVLARHPELGRTGRVEGTRELVISRWPYIVVYHIKGQEVRILRVRHAAQEWPESFPSEE